MVQLSTPKPVSVMPKFGALLTNDPDPDPKPTQNATIHITRQTGRQTDGSIVAVAIADHTI